MYLFLLSIAGPYHESDYLFILYFLFLQSEFCVEFNIV